MNSLGNFIRGHVTVTMALLLSAALVLGAWVWGYTYLTKLGQPVILHWYHSPGVESSIRETVPVERIGWVVNGIGSTALLILVLNGVIAGILDSRDRLWGKALAISTACLAALLFIAVAAIISVN